MSKKWVVNASPLIILAKLDLIFLFDQLCDEWLIPSGVVEEINLGDENDPAKIWIKQYGMQKVRNIGSVNPVIENWDLGKGESEVLSWVYENYENYEYLAILDDLAARNCAKALNIEVHGTLWVLISAKREQKISNLTNILSQLHQIDFRISPELLAMAKRLAGEV